MFSVIIPAYNEAAVIERCLRSMLRGARPDELEIIVVANGCRDDTAKRARAFGPPKDLAVIEEEAVRCQQIVEGLLDLSRASTAPRAEVDLRELCEDVVARLRESDAIDDVAVTIDGNGTATGSPQKLRQLVTNLIKNAIEAAGPQGSVRIHTEATSEWVTLSVADSGPGIAPEVKDRLFEPFFTTKARGTGLGLAVSQAIARAHGGSIKVDRSPTGGALFTLLLRNTAAEAHSWQSRASLSSMIRRTC